MMCGNTPKTDLAVFSYYFKNCSDTSSIFERSLKSSCKMTDDYVQEFASTDKQRRNIYSGCIAHIQTDRPIGRSTGLGLRSRFCWVGSTSMGSQQCILGYFSFLFFFFSSGNEVAAGVRSQGSVVGERDALFFSLLPAEDETILTVGERASVPQRAWDRRTHLHYFRGGGRALPRTGRPSLGLLVHRFSASTSFVC
jgi:hypothetical protein